MARSLFISSLLFAAGQATIVKRFTDGSSPSGTVPSDTIKDCTFWVNVQSGDTCSKIESSEGISHADFVQFNPSLKSDCSGLKVGYSYCIEENYGLGPSTTSKPVTSTTTTSTSTGSAKPSPTQSGLVANCNNFYKVVSGDGCQAIVDKYGTFTLNDFYSWNPAVKSDCTGLQAGYYVCVGVPGSTSTRPATTTTATSTGTPGPSPTQSGIASNCNKYYKAVSGDGCYDIATKYGITQDQFYTWNPAVGSDCSKLFAGYYYCVGVPGATTTKPATTTKTTTTATATGPSPTQSGITKDCNKYYKAVSGDGCYDIATKFGITTNQFYSWNPAVGSDCSKLFAGYYYCVGTPTATVTTKTPTTTTTAPSGPSPTQSGIASNCNKYYKAVSGDGCYDIAQRNSISLNQFYTWNPAVGSDCSKLFAGYYYCVGVK